MRQALFVTLFIAVAFVANAADIEDGLWMYLPLNEGTGQTVADHGPNEFETELSKEPPKWVDAKHDSIKNAMEFDGKSHYVKIDMEAQKKDIDSHFDDKKGITICAWVKVLKVGTDAHGQTRQPIVMKGNANAWEFALYVYDDFGAGMSVWTCPGSGVSEPNGPGAAPQGEWIHQCGTFKLKEGVRVYVNGDKNPVAQLGDNGGGPCETGTRPVFIAHREDGQWLNAVIAEVYMWDRVIDIDEMNLAMKNIGGLAVQPGGKLTTTWGNVKRRR
ncbi:hypothetical protein C6495_13625 [Candidatus Poribacteria bacterium]|nr:MAG: hypothetical protein C6495_13625 [Candidatus Poribacteria bacterium]